MLLRLKRMIFYKLGIFLRLKKARSYNIGKNEITDGKVKTKIVYIISHDNRK